MFEVVEGLLAEHASLESRLALPETHADARMAKTLNQRYAELTAVITTWRDWQRIGRLKAAEFIATAQEPRTGVRPCIQSCRPRMTANRPTSPPMNNTGMKTATREIVIERMVKPISREASSAATIPDLPISR